MFCTHCGNPLRAEAKFCPKCGQRVEPLLELPTTGPVEPGSASPPLEITAVMPTPIVSVAAQAAPMPAPVPVSPLTGGEVAPSLASSGANDTVEERVQAAGDHPPAATGVAAPEGVPMPPAEPSSLPGGADGAEPILPLAVGDSINGRYSVLAVLKEQPGMNVYRARDAWRCASCDFAGNLAGETFCLNCGAELGAGGACLLEETAAGHSAAPAGNNTFVAGARHYRVAAEEKTAFTRQPFPLGMTLSVGQRTDVGRRYEIDEDSLFVLTLMRAHQGLTRPALGLFIVADGIGGAASGEVASKLAIGVISQRILSDVLLPLQAGTLFSDDQLGECIKAAIGAANVEIYEQAQKAANNMGSTVTLALVVEDKAYVANVGDSRTYLWGGMAGLKQITHDHSVVARLLNLGMITADEVYTHPQRNVIFRSLGEKAEIEVDTFVQPLQSGNRLILCCDGVWEMVRQSGIEDALMDSTLAAAEPQRTCDMLIQASNAAGGEDNISIIIVRVDEVAELARSAPGAEGAGSL